MTRGNPNPAGRCIFCGGLGLSKEHVLPDWLAEIFPRAATDSHTVGSFDWINIPGHVVPIQNTTRKQGQAGTRKVRVVCETNCNNGWLSRLEAATKPLLFDLVHGYSRTLTVADQRLLATWIAKTTMTAEFVRSKEVAISQATRDRFYATPEPPAHWSIWIAFYSGTEWLAGNIFHHGVGMYLPPLEMKPGVKNTQYTVITLGHLMCICAGSEDERQEFKLDARMQPAVRQLWPASGLDIAWPPERSIDDQGAQAVTKAFGRWMGLDVPPMRSARPPTAGAPK
jgi:hypothetical protein